MVTIAQGTPAVMRSATEQGTPHPLLFSIFLSLASTLVGQLEMLGVGSIALPFNVLFAVLLLVLAYRGKRDSLLLAIVAYFLIAHEYGPDPYSDTYESYFGATRYLCLVLFLTQIVELKPTTLAAILATYIGAISLKSFAVSPEIAPIFFDGYFFAVFLAFLCDKNSKCSATRQVPIILFYFTMIMPLNFLVTYVMGTYVELNGSIYFAWGHYFGFLCITSAIYYITHAGRTVSYLWLPALCVTFYVFMQSAQSAHLIILALALGALVVFGRSYGLRVAGFTAFVLFVVYFAHVLSTADTSSWVYLKFNQVLQAATGNIDQSNNSFAIRAAQAITIYAQFDALEMIFGRGLGAFYTDDFGLLTVLDLHDATFPDEQMATGMFRTVHETLVKVFLVCGGFGLGILLWKAVAVAKKFIRAHDVYGIAVLMFFPLLFWTSPHTSIFLLVMLTCYESRFRDESPVHM